MFRPLALILILLVSMLTLPVATSGRLYSWQVGVGEPVIILYPNLHFDLNTTYQIGSRGYYTINFSVYDNGSARFIARYMEAGGYYNAKKIKTISGYLYRETQVTYAGHLWIKINDLKNNNIILISINLTIVNLNTNNATIIMKGSITAENYTAGDIFKYLGYRLTPNYYSEERHGDTVDFTLKGLAPYPRGEYWLLNFLWEYGIFEPFKILGRTGNLTLYSITVNVTEYILNPEGGYSTAGIVTVLGRVNGEGIILDTITVNNTRIHVGLCKNGSTTMWLYNDTLYMEIRNGCIKEASNLTTLLSGIKAYLLDTKYGETSNVLIKEMEIMEERHVSIKDMDRVAISSTYENWYKIIAIIIIVAFLAGAIIALRKL
ncbi:MAG: hypothetical protein F7C37_06920 [Desulfurococcales archaeon]|nr:hypothetical protein [Desulfurococcales archaeon]